MSAPKVPDGPVAARSGRRATGWTIGFCLGVFIAATFCALTQPPRPDPFAPGTLAEKFFYPYEQNGFMRLPMVSGDLNDVFVIPGSGHIWVAGNGGLILVSADNGRSWQRRTFSLEIGVSRPPSSNEKAAGIKRIQWGLRSAHASDPVKSVPIDKKKLLDMRRQMPVVKTPERQPEKAKPQLPLEKPLESTPNLQAVFFRDDTFGWICGESGTILSTTDGGRSWQRQDSGTDTWLNALYFKDRERGWACGEKGTILWTTDGGQNWKRQSSGADAGLEALYFTNRESGWACGENGTILRTTDGGRTWQPQASGVDAQLYAIHFTDAKQGWACGIEGTILSTANGGQTWQRQTSGTETWLYALYFVDMNRGWACGKSGTILSTIDGGRSWQDQASGTDAWMKTLYFSDRKRGWACGVGGTILRTTDGGRSWQRQASGAENGLEALYFTDRERGWACGGYGTILLTTDSGHSWQQRTGGTNARLQALHFTDREYGWACGESGTILSTTDGGRSWQRQSGGTDDVLHDLHFTDRERGWACGKDGMILSTVDGGRTWNRQKSGTDAWLYALDFADRELGWACGAGGVLLLTNDGGRTWNRKESNTDAWLDDIYFMDRENGWACGEGGTILATTDGGQSWQRQITGAYIGLKGLSVLDRNRSWACGQGGMILSTTDGGQSWRRKTGVTDAGLHALQFMDAKLGWACGYGGTILRTTNGGETWNLPQYRRLPAPWYWCLCLALILVSLFVVQRRNQPVATGETVADLLASDKPLEAGDPDPMDLHSISSGLARFIANRSTEPPLTMAVTGEWGTGKSSLMNLLFHDLKKRRFQPVWFNAWHHQKGEQLLASLYAHIRKQAVPPMWHFSGILFRLRLLFRRGRRNRLAFGALAFLLFAAFPFLEGAVRSLSDGVANLVRALIESDLGEVRRLLDFGKLIQADPKDWIGALLASPAVAAAFRAVRAFGLSPQRLLAFGSDGGRKSSLDPGARSRFAQEFKDVSASLDLGAMVIFIDDLDRCSKENVVEILESINFLAVSGRCFIILGMARQWVETCVALQFKELAEETESGKSVENGIAHRRQFARQYLEKLINIEVPVPAPSPDAARALLAPDPPEPASPLARMLTAVGKAAKKYAPVVCLAGLAVLAWCLWHVLGEEKKTAEKPKDLLVAPANSRSGELVLNDGRLRIPLNEMAAPKTGSEDRSLEIVLRGDPNVFEEGLAIGSLGKGESAAELVLRYAPEKERQHSAKAAEEKRKSKPPGPDKKKTGKAGFRSGAEDENNSGLWLALLAGLGLATIGGRYLLMRPQRFTEDSKTFRDALNIWHPWIVLMNRTPRTIKRFLNRLRYVAMRLRSESEHLGLYERIRRKVAGKPETTEAENREGVPEPVLVALGAIYHMNPAWVRDAETLEGIFSEDSSQLAGRLRQAFPQADADPEGLAETASVMREAVDNYLETFGLGIKPLIHYREAFLAILAESGM